MEEKKAWKHSVTDLKPGLKLLQTFNPTSVITSDIPNTNIFRIISGFSILLPYVLYIWGHEFKSTL